LRNVPLRKIAEQSGLSSTALFRHRKHLSQKMVKAAEAAEVSDASTLLGKVEDAVETVLRITREAEAKGSLSVALNGLKTLGGYLDMVAKLNMAAGPKSIGTPESLDASSLPDASLELEIAKQVSVATSGFNEAEIQRMKLLLGESIDSRNRCSEIEALPATS